LSRPESEHISPGVGRPQKRPLATTSAVIYATLALLALTVPRGLVNWSRNFDPNPVQELLMRTAQGLQSLSRDFGANWPYVRGRELFLRVTGKRDD
jgi:hypothetical protein